MDLSVNFNNRLMAILPSELDRLLAKAKNAPDFNILEANFVAHEKTLSAEFGESEKPRLRNGTIGDNGVAVIFVKGVLFNVESYWDEILAYYFGGTSYQSLMRDIDLVMNNSQIQVVGFHVHSPGGEAFGMNETSNKIAALSAKKNTVGYAYGLAASAGYGLIAATGEIYADANAWVGSIGTVMNWMDFTGFYEQLGIAYEEVTSSNAPYKRLDIRIPEERAVFIQELDGVEEVFIKSVAKNRKTTVDKVKSDFGKGAVLAGKAAKAAGMIDGIGSWDEVLKQLQTSARKAQRSSANNIAKIGAENNMNWKSKLKDFFASSEIQSILNENDESVASEDNNSPTSSDQTNSAEDKPQAQPGEDTSIEHGQTTAAAQQNHAAPSLDLAKFKSDAESFAVSEIKEGRMSPREREEFVENFAQASIDDAISPLASGSSRVDRLKSLQQNRKSSMLTEETVNSETNQVLLAQTGNVSTQEKTKSILEKTPLGKRALQMSDKK